MSEMLWASLGDAEALLAGLALRFLRPGPCRLRGTLPPDPTDMRPRSLREQMDGASGS